MSKLPYVQTIDTERVEPGGRDFPYLRAVAGGPVIIADDFGRTPRTENLPQQDKSFYLSVTQTKAGEYRAIIRHCEQRGTQVIRYADTPEDAVSSAFRDLWDKAPNNRKNPPEVRMSCDVRVYNHIVGTQANDRMRLLQHIDVFLDHALLDDIIAEPRLVTCGNACRAGAHADQLREALEAYLATED